MLEIVIPEREYYDEEKNEFFHLKGATLKLEHSLIALSEWEAKWHKPFLDDKEKTTEEMIDYIRCMTVSPKNVNPYIYYGLTSENVRAIRDYIQDSRTATWFSDDAQLKEKAGKKGRKPREIITSELIYYWLVACTIPFDPVEKWHINRILTLVRIYSVKNEDPKKNKMSKSALAKRNTSLNAARRKALHSTG